MPQYVKCKFRQEDSRTYTYHNDGDPVAPGDIVKVADRSGDGWKRVYVVEVDGEAPQFDTKPILGLVEPESAPADELPQQED